jgi:pimeloyl-ACP methyl ester carboxylesterase
VTDAVPDIGRSLQHGAYTTNHFDVGEGPVVLLLHGSGPGVTAWANWRLLMPELETSFRVVAPDLAGFGYTTTSGEVAPSRALWLDHLTSFLDALQLTSATVIGNSFGGALALWLTLARPQFVERLVLMGSVGTQFELTPGLDAVWGYQPSPEAMEALLTYFVADRSRLPANLGELRYQASIRPGTQERYERLFPAPRQRWIDEFTLSDSELTAVEQPVLLIHGREDAVIPLSSSLRLLERLDNAELHVFPHCGHWVQIERARPFAELVRRFASVETMSET